MPARIAKLVVLILLLVWRLAEAAAVPDDSVTAQTDPPGGTSAPQSSTVLHEPPLATPTPPGGNPATEQTPLKEEGAQFAFASTNLLKTPPRDATQTAAAAELAEMHRRLTLARTQHQLKQYPGATQNLRSVLESNVPDDLKRPALMELALVAQDEKNLSQAQQMFGQYLARWPKDSVIPEILLRQGLLYREMGLHNLAINKFYSVMTTALTLQPEAFDQHQRLVVLAQTEIAETQYQQGKYVEAVDSLKRLLKLDYPGLAKGQIQHRLVLALANLHRSDDVVSEAQDFLARYPTLVERSEVRFVLASALKQLGRNSDALRQVMQLLETQQNQAPQHPETLAYWQRRSGNEIANQLYVEGDFLHALEIYQSLVGLDTTPAWVFPVWYQIGLVYERLAQPSKATAAYDQILLQSKTTATNSPPSVKSVIEMAKWRKDALQWQTGVHARTLSLRQSVNLLSEAGSSTDSPTATSP